MSPASRPGWPGGGSASAGHTQQQPGVAA